MRLHVIEDKTNHEFLEYGSDCWPGPLRNALSLLEALRWFIGKETDPERKRLMEENLHLFETEDPRDPYWDPNQPPGPQGFLSLEERIRRQRDRIRLQKLAERAASEGVVCPACGSFSTDHKYVRLDAVSESGRQSHLVCCVCGKEFGPADV